MMKKSSDNRTGLSASNADLEATGGEMSAHTEKVMLSQKDMEVLPKVGMSHSRWATEEWCKLSLEWMKGASDEIAALRARVAELERFREAVVGWREVDWEKAFSRRTADLLVAHAIEQEKRNEG